MAINDTVEYVKLLAQWFCECEPEYIVLVIMLELGIPVNHDGFEYLKEAILLQYEDPMRDLANDIYPEIAEKSRKHISCAMVETSIRSTVKSARNRTDMGIWQKFLPTVLLSKNRAPSNAEVIAGLARIVELWYGCSQAYRRQRDREVVNSGTE